MEDANSYQNNGSEYYKEWEKYNDNDYYKEWEKLVKKLFGDKDMMDTSKIYDEIRKACPNYSESDLKNTKAYDTNFTWDDISEAINGGIMTITELRRSLRKIYLNKQKN